MRNATRAGFIWSKLSLALREGNLLLLALLGAPVAQLDRASDYGSEGLGFKSLRVHQFLPCGRRLCGERRLKLVGLICSAFDSIKPTDLGWPPCEHRIRPDPDCEFIIAAHTPSHRDRDRHGVADRLKLRGPRGGNWRPRICRAERRPR